MSTDTRSLPWTEKNDVTIHANEYVQNATINRALRRLLENDKWTLKYCLVVTPERIGEEIGELQSSGQALRVDVTNTGEVFYIPLFKKISP